MAVKKPEYKTQKEAEDSLDFDPQPTTRSNEIEQPKNSYQMKNVKMHPVQMKGVQMKGVQMKSVVIFPVKMFELVML